MDTYTFNSFKMGFVVKAKDGSKTVVITHLKWLLAQGGRIEVFSTDQGKELLNTRLKAFLKGRGIKFLRTNAYSPEENGLVEKMNGVLMARVRSLLTTAHMPDCLWGEAFKYAVEVVNVSPSTALGGDTPYARRFGESLNVEVLKIWGCIVHVFTPKKLRTNKLENPGKLGLFVGFAKNSDSVRVLNFPRRTRTRGLRRVYPSRLEVDACGPRLALRRARRCAPR